MNHMDRLKTVLQMLSGPAAAAAPTPGPSAQQIRKFIQHVLNVSTAQNARGVRAREAWRTLARGALELLRVLSEDPGE